MSRKKDGRSRATEEGTPSCPSLRKVRSIAEGVSRYPEEVAVQELRGSSSTVQVGTRFWRRRGVKGKKENNYLRVMTEPAKPLPLSKRTPLPPADLYTSIFPVSGWNCFAGSSVVIRHWIAKPLVEMRSCVRPSCAKVAPAAI